MNNIKKFFKTRDRSGEPHKSNVSSGKHGTSDVLKSMKLEDALITDKQNEEKDDVERGRKWFHPHTKRKLAEHKLKEGRSMLCIANV